MILRHPGAVRRRARRAALPDVLKKVLDSATRPKGSDGYVLHLTYEEARR